MAFQYRKRSAEAWDKRANQSGGEFEGFLKEEFKVFKGKKGSNAIRILPPTFENADHYGIDIYVHYSVGPANASVLCLQNMKDERCPLCEARNRALKIGDTDDAKSLKAGKRVLVWLIDRNDEDQGPVLWAMPYTLDREFSVLAKDRQTGTILALDDPDEGFDIYFERNGEGMTTKYEGKQLARRPSQIPDAPLDFIEDRPLPSVLIWRSYDEVKDLFEGGPEPASAAAPSRRGAPAEEPVTRRRATNGAAPEESVRRRSAPADEPEPPKEPEVTRRRAAPAEDAPRTRREEINDEVPFDKPHHIEEPSDEPKTGAQKLRERYAR